MGRKIGQLRKKLTQIFTQPNSRLVKPLLAKTDRELKKPSESGRRVAREFVKAPYGKMVLHAGGWTIRHVKGIFICATPQPSQIQLDLIKLYTYQGH